MRPARIGATAVAACGYSVEGIEKSRPERPFIERYKHLTNKYMPRKTIVADAALVSAREALGAKLRERRLALGYSQEDIASTGSVDRSTLSRIENGKRTYSVDYLLILDALYTKMEDKANGR